MKKIYSFLFYKLYRFAKAQEETVSPIIGFLGLASIFELFHLLILLPFIEAFSGDKFGFVNYLERYAGWIFIFVGFLLNYIIFIYSKLIYRINDYYQEKKYTVWKGNLLFFGYIVILFLNIIVQTWWHQKNK